MEGLRLTIDDTVVVLLLWCSTAIIFFFLQCFLCLREPFLLGLFSVIEILFAIKVFFFVWMVSSLGLSMKSLSISKLIISLASKFCCC